MKKAKNNILKMSDSQDKTPTADGGKQTPINPTERRTGQGARNEDTRSGAEPEAPGNKNTDTPGSPNQGTEAR